MNASRRADAVRQRPGPPLAVTMGEPAGIGGELSLRAWQGRHDADLPCFLVIDDPGRLQRLSRSLDLGVAVVPIEAPGEALEVFGRGLPVLALGDPVTAEPGRPSPATAAAVLESISLATRLTLGGETAAVVTNPIHKKVLLDAGFEHPGHTEFLAELCGSPGKAVMMLATPGLRTVPVTIHQPLAEVPASLTGALILETARTTVRGLQQQFGIAHPRLAVAGLNPHAGEDGKLGTEDGLVIAPAVASLQAEGIDVFGPVAADSLFHPAARRGYDAALCMYHDQALIPVKTLDFEHGVNVTLGLPIVRTSPDHGTALDIAGKGLASPVSLLAAIALAGTLAANKQTGGTQGTTVYDHV
ncbi:4-hydroxythreonine-4-phosphate dehydrogenase PdxA [Pelagibius sp.]|uniref:4-hydroxythreonine-4-phosphate dehydrogenase PdxA n=1 Tax=Pelagibius sp. TaxID=1931238 RepID=UPI003B5090AD